MGVGVHKRNIFLALIKQKHNTYSLTDGISEKVYNKIIKQIINELPTLEEWHSKDILKKFDNITWNKSIIELHKPENIGEYKKNFYKRRQLKRKIRRLHYFCNLGYYNWWQIRLRNFL